jgi:hypothetical protein
MDVVDSAQQICEPAQRAHEMPSVGVRTKEMIELRERFLLVLATAPDAGPGELRSIESAVEKLDVQTASSLPAKWAKRYWAVGGSCLAKRIRAIPCGGVNHAASV